MVPVLIAKFLSKNVGERGKDGVSLEFGTGQSTVLSHSLLYL